MKRSRTVPPVLLERHLTLLGLFVFPMSLNATSTSSCNFSPASHGFLHESSPSVMQNLSTVLHLLSLCCFVIFCSSSKGNNCKQEASQRAPIILGGASASFVVKPACCCPTQSEVKAFPVRHTVNPHLTFNLCVDS